MKLYTPVWPQSVPYVAEHGFDDKVCSRWDDGGLWAAVSESPPPGIGMPQEAFAIAELSFQMSRAELLRHRVRGNEGPCEAKLPPHVWWLPAEVLNQAEHRFWMPDQRHGHEGERF